MKFVWKSVVAASALLLGGAALAQQGEVVKIVRIDPLTGLMGPVGTNQDKSY